MKKFLIGIGASLVLLIIIAILLPFIIDLNKYQDRYRPLIEDALNRKIMLTDMRLTIIPRLGARISGFTVMDDPSFSTGAFASLTALEVGVKLLPLLSGRVEIEEIKLEDPVITVIKNRDGILNISTLGGAGKAIPPATPPSPAEGPLRALALLTVEDLSLTSGRLAYEDRSSKKPVEYRLQDLAVHLESVRLGATPHAHVETTVQPFNIPIILDGTFGPLTENIEFKTIKLNMAVGKSEAALAGSLLNGRFDGTLTSALIASTDLPISLPLTKPVEIKDIQVSAEGLYPMKEGLAIEDAITIKGLKASVVSGESAVNIAGSAIDGNVKLTATSASINSADLPVSLPLTKPVFIKSLQLTARSHYPQKPESPLSMADVPALDFFVVSGNSQIVVKGSALEGNIKLNATSPSINTADLPIAVPLRKPIEINDVRLAATMIEKEARITNLALHLLGGQIFVQGGLILGAKPPPFDTHVILEKIQLGPLLDIVTEKVSGSGTAVAQIMLHGQGISMPQLTKSLAGTSRFSVHDGKIDGVNILAEVAALLKAVGVHVGAVKSTVFSLMEGELSVKNGVVHVDRLWMDSHDFQGTAGGAIGFDQSLNLRARLNLSEALSKQIAGASPVAKVALSKGRISVPLIITGTTQTPRYALDSKALGGKVQEQVKEQVKEAVDDLLKGKPVDIEKSAGALKKLFGR